MNYSNLLDSRFDWGYKELQLLSFPQRWESKGAKEIIECWRTKPCY